MYDAHVHSTFSPDGSSSLEEYSKLIDKGFVKGIGFAEHLDFMPECGAYGFLKYDSYLDAVNVYKKKGYEFYSGAEVDYAKKVEYEIINTLSHNHYDYTICSVHMIDGKSVSDKNIDYFSNRQIFSGTVENYYKELHSSTSVTEFDVIGHIGVYKRYLENDFLVKYNLKQRIDELEHLLAHACAVSDKIVEVNTSGLFSVCASTIPDNTFLRLYYDYGGRMVCVGSDAHNAAHVARGFDIAVKNLKDIGFRYIFQPWNKEKPIKID